MATDDLIDDGTVADTKPAPAAAISAADLTKAVKEGMAELGGNLQSYQQQMGQYVNQVVQSAQTASQAGTANASQSDLTQQLLTEPEKAINGILQKWAAENLGPYFSTQVEDAYENLVDTQRTKIDRQYGEGTFDELVAPELEAVVAQTPNKASKSSKKYISTVVQSILGHDNIRPKLMDKHTAKVEADKKANEAPMVLDGGRRRGKGPNLSPEDIAFLAHYEGETNKKVDRKIMEEALAVRGRDGGWTADNFPGLTNK